jgi:hypothetical protein
MLGEENRMKIEKNPLAALKLLNIAGLVEELVEQASQESHSYHLAGRLARDPGPAFCEAIIDGVIHGDVFTSTIIKTPIGYALLQCAMREASMRLWEELWNGAHPEQIGMGWQVEDFALMEVWRKKVRTIVEQCHQEAILTMSPKEYIQKLTVVGVSKEVAEELAHWLSEIYEGGTPST